MTTKAEYLAQLRAEFDRWEALLAGLSEAQLIAPQPHSPLSIKDELAHLWAWQQRSVARLEAALENRDPLFPAWPADLEAEPDGQPHQMNAWIYDTYRDWSWADVHQGWRENFLRFLELGAAVPEEQLLAPGRYAWLGEHPLALVLQASYEHHHIDHLEPLLKRLG